MTLTEVIESEAAATPTARLAEASDGTRSWSVGDVTFAMLELGGGVAAFRLDPAVAGAAVRTPDTSPSPRGGGWVRFAPTIVDDHAADRARAWFGSAARLAAAGH